MDCDNSGMKPSPTAHLLSLDRKQCTRKYGGHMNISQLEILELLFVILREIVIFLTHFVYQTDVFKILNS